MMNPTAIPGMNGGGAAQAAPSPDPSQQQTDPSQQQAASPPATSPFGADEGEYTTNDMVGDVAHARQIIKRINEKQPAFAKHGDEIKRLLVKGMQEAMQSTKREAPAPILGTPRVP
jgi:hypothetical protein